MPAYVLVAVVSLAALAGFVVLSWALRDKARKTSERHLRAVDGESKREGDEPLAQAA